MRASRITPVVLAAALSFVQPAFSLAEDRTKEGGSEGEAKAERPPSEKDDGGKKAHKGKKAEKKEEKKPDNANKGEGEKK